MGDQVSGFFGDVPGLIGFIKGGKLKPIGIAATKRQPLLSQVPTLDEQGIHGVESNNWYALFAPANTSPARIEQLNAAVRRVLTSEAVRQRLVDSGTEPAPGSPGELAALVKSDTSKWSRIIRDKKIKGE
jgi:tripartite-type tricarboxylate transporter receptor subunit TctC